MPTLAQLSVQIIPAPPRPPKEFSYEYANELYRWLENISRYMTGVNYLRGSGLYLPGLPETGYGLIEGEVFSNDGILTIVRLNEIWIGPLYATGEIGDVTVSV